MINTLAKKFVARSVRMSLLYHLLQFKTSPRSELPRLLQLMLAMLKMNPNHVLRQELKHVALNRRDAKPEDLRQVLAGTPSLGTIHSKFSSALLRESW